MNTPPSKCFHNGIILIVTCFKFVLQNYINDLDFQNILYKLQYI